MRVRGGVRTQNVIMHGVLSPPLRDAPSHGITPSRYSDWTSHVQKEQGGLTLEIVPSNLPVVRSTAVVRGS